MRKSLSTVIHSLILILIIGLCVSGTAFSQTTGKIVGTVVDVNTGDPLPGANVLVAGTNFGAAAGVDGYYTIINVPAGIHDVQVSVIGYKKVIQKDVLVSVDQIARVDFDLEMEVVPGEEVVVYADRDILHKEVSNSQLVVTATEMTESAGIRTINHYLEKQPGITGENHLEIRGGSADQTGTIVNGLTFVNPRIGTASASIPISSVEQVSLVTGGYSAEYGNFRSGLINIVTKSGDTDRYSGSLSYSRNIPGMKRFGKSLYNPDNVLLRPLFDPEPAFKGTAAVWPQDQYPMEYETYPLFRGWNRLAEAYNRGLPEEDQVSPVDLYLWSAWMYQVKPDFDALKYYADTSGMAYTVTDAQIQAIIDHAHESEGSHADYNLDFGVGGPLPVINELLGGATFYLSHQTLNTNYIQPVTRNAENTSTTMLTMKYNIGKSLTVKINNLYRKIKGIAPVMPTSGAVPSLGDPDDADSGGGGMMEENNLAKLFDQGDVYYWHPTFWHPKDQTLYMTGTSLNYVVNPKTFIDLTLSYAWQKDFSEPKFTRDRTGIINFGPVWVNEMPYGRTFSADTVYNPQDPTDFYVHSIFEDVGGEIVSATGRRFSGKTGMYNENSVTQMFRVKGDLSSQMTRHHFLKGGFDLNYYDLDNDLWVYWTGYDTDYDLRFHVKPWQLGGYIQDQITYEGIVARLGLRIDYYNSGGAMWPTGDRFNAEAFVEGEEGAHPAMDNYRYEFLSQGINVAWDRFNRIDEEYREIIKNNPDTTLVPFMQKTKNHLAISPRIGISFPVTERSKFYFNYGHFRSAVPYSEMYMYNYRYSKGQGLNTIGNPNLAPPRTISYELGGSYNLADQYLITLSGFYKDVTGQHTNLNVDGQSIADGYTTRTNNEYEDIQGLELDVRKSVGKYLTGWINFRYLLEKDGKVGREYLYEDPERNEDAEQIYFEAEEDRPAPRPAAAANLTFHVPYDLKMGGIGNSLLGGWLISGIFEWEMGEAYTHNPEDIRNVSNNIRWPDYYMVDMKISKGFEIMKGIRASFYVDIQNLLNLKVNWMNKEWCFRSAIDRDAYLNSLRLPMYDDPEYKDKIKISEEGVTPEEYVYQGKISPSGNPYFAGDDRPGDLRPDDVPYQAFQEVVDFSDETASQRNAIYYEIKTGDYYEYAEDSEMWVKADKKKIKKIINDKAYINNPNNKDLWLYGYPREIWVGVNISF
ncbi:TonB-dependent receptor [bacterium]|nr:TonB-dependent receptor [bacterium]